MRNAILVILVFSLQNCSQSFSQETDSIHLKYASLAGEELNLRDGNYYDTENKPTSFELAPVSRSEDSVLIVDIYRTIESENGEIEPHYYKTEVYVLEDLGSEEPIVLSLEKMFEGNKSRFFNTVGFKIAACMIPKKLYLKLNSPSQCPFYKEITIVYPV